MKKDNSIFIPGSNWLFYKIYCGVKTSDMVLLDIIKPLTKFFLKDDLIDKWFFIRYSDPEPHLRIRFHLKNPNDFGSIIIKIKSYLSNYIINNQIWDVQICTYKREIERYGKNSIEIVEQFFFLDSIQALSIIENNEEEEKFITVYNWCEFIISLFALDNKQQISFLEKMAIKYRQEFEMGNELNKQLSHRYRKIENKLLNQVKMNNDEICKFKKNVNQLLQLKKLNRLEVDPENLLSSLIHMSFNRCFNENQRHYEMIFYDFIFRKSKTKYIKYGKL